MNTVMITTQLQQRKKKRAKAGNARAQTHTHANGISTIERAHNIEQENSKQRPASTDLDGVLNEEDRDVVANQIKVSLVSVELGREAPHVTHRVRGAPACTHSMSANSYFDVSRVVFKRTLKEM